MKPSASTGPAATLVAVAMAVLVVIGLAAFAPAAAIAAEHHQPPPERQVGREGGEAQPKPLPARSILITLAVIVGGGFAVVLAGLGYFSPNEEDS